MNPLGASLLLVCVVVVASAPRHIAMLGMMAAVLYIPLEQSIHMAGLNLFGMRFVELAGFIRVTTKKEFSFSRVNGFDKLFFLLFAYSTIVFLLRSKVDFAYRIGVTVDASLCYFTFRGLIRNVSEFKRFLKGFLILLAPYAIPLMIETLTGRNPFNILGHFDPGGYTRNGRQRAFGSFEHPSLAGTLGASFIPLYIAYAYEKVNRKIAFFGIGVCLVIIWESDSGAPVSCLMFAVVGWMFWKFRMHMSGVRRSIVAILILLSLFMNSSIWYLPAKLSELTGGDGYHRSYLIDIAFQNIGKWGIAGMPLEETSNWFPTLLASGVADITNQYISFAVTGGFLSMALFIFLFVKGFSILGRAMAAIRSVVGTPTESEAILWGLGVVLLVHAGNFLGIIYYDQTFVIWYMHLAMISTLSESSQRESHDIASNILSLPMSNDKSREKGQSHEHEEKHSTEFDFLSTQLLNLRKLPLGFLFASLLMLEFVPAANCAQLYVAQAAIGEGSGTNAENASGIEFFNDAGNWTTSDKEQKKIGPGGVIHLCGTISSSLVIQGSGAPSNPITVYFEPGASMSAPNWNQNGRHGNAAIYIAKDFITIDGGVNGLIRATENGTELATHLYNAGVYVNNAKNITIQNLTIENLYVRMRGTDPSFSRIGGAGVYFLQNCDNALVNKCILKDMYYPVMMAFGSCRNFEVKNCELSNMSDGILIGSANRGCILTHALIHDNRISIGSNWEGNPSIHRSCIHAFAVHREPNSAINDLRIYNNFFTGDIANNATAYCFIEGFVTAPWVFNNLFVQPNSNSGGDGFLAFKGTESGMAMNNTFVGAAGGREIAINSWSVTIGTSLGHDLTIENNIFYHCATALYNTMPQAVTSDYNVFDASPQFFDKKMRGIGDLAAWKADTGQDVHSSTRDSRLDLETYIPRPGSSAIGTGSDESRFFAFDKNGTARELGAKWDIGAFNHATR